MCWWAQEQSKEKEGLRSNDVDIKQDEPESKQSLRVEDDKSKEGLRSNDVDIKQDGPESKQSFRVEDDNVDDDPFAGRQVVIWSVEHPYGSLKLDPKTNIAYCIDGDPTAENLWTLEKTRLQWSGFYTIRQMTSGMYLTARLDGKKTSVFGVSSGDNDGSSADTTLWSFYYKGDNTYEIHAFYPIKGNDSYILEVEGSVHKDKEMWRALTINQNIYVPWKFADRYDVESLWTPLFLYNNTMGTKDIPRTETSHHGIKKVTDKDFTYTVGLTISTKASLGASIDLLNLSSEISTQIKSEFTSDFKTSVTTDDWGEVKTDYIIPAGKWYGIYYLNTNFNSSIQAIDDEFKFVPTLVATYESDVEPQNKEFLKHPTSFIKVK